MNIHHRLGVMRMEGALMAVMTCQEMYRNGVMTGMERVITGIVSIRILRDRAVGLIEFFAAARGTAVPAAYALPTAPAMIRPAWAAITGSGAPPLNNLGSWLFDPWF